MLNMIIAALIKPGERPKKDERAEPKPKKPLTADEIAAIIRKEQAERARIMASQGL